jgi:hypothetical protein
MRRKAINTVGHMGPIARAERTDKKVCTGKVLASVLAGVELPADEAAAWHRDLQAAREARIPATDKWE